MTLSYTIEDEHGATSSSTVTITVTGTNDGPVANADVAAGHENETLTIDVLANDTDVDDGAVLSVMSAWTPAGQGTASIVANQVAFDPGTDFDHLAVGDSATVTLSYTIEDEHGATSSSHRDDHGHRHQRCADRGRRRCDRCGDGAGTPAGNLTDTGTIAFSDVDLSDLHSVGPVAPSGGALGTLTASVTTGQ